MNYHTPILVPEILSLFDPKANKVFVDATLGNGGHALYLLERQATVFGIDADPTNLQIAKQRLATFTNFHPINDNFIHLQQICEQQIHTPINGILFDLGLSHNQITATDRGFSFHDPVSLDMRVNPNSSLLTAKQIVNTYNFDQLVDIFSRLSQEILAKPIATAIIDYRRRQLIDSANTLAKIISEVYCRQHLKPPHHPATKVFLALKIVVNQELDNLNSALHQTISVLQPGATVAIITFHSTEDRLVKLFIKSQHFVDSGLVHPLATEISNNPLSRSAKLRWYRI